MDSPTDYVAVGLMCVFIGAPLGVLPIFVTLSGLGVAAVIVGFLLLATGGTLTAIGAVAQGVKVGMRD